MEDFNKLFQTFSSLKIGVIGDVMLDSYLWGNVDRISPEAPVPIILLHKKDQRIGGAGNVALNCVSLDASVSVLSVIGNDANGQTLKILLDGNNIDTSYLIQSKERITTNKTRVISKNQQMMRLDEETTNDLTPSEESLLLESIKKYIESESPNVIILEDYNKGILTERIISEVIMLCKANDVIVAVDPKIKNFFAYNGVDIFKPNLKEIKEALSVTNEQTDQTTLQKFHKALYEKLNHKISFITLSDKGVFYQKENQSEIIASHLRDIADVSGAGDTVIAVAALVYAASQNVRLMAEIANIAGGLVCEAVGTVAINKEKLLVECNSILTH